jgi:hypothetical protein
MAERSHPRPRAETNLLGKLIIVEVRDFVLTHAHIYPRIGRC